MTTTPGTTSRRSHVVRPALYCITLLPLGVVALLATLTGRAQEVVRWWLGLRTRVLRVPTPEPVAPPRLARTAGHAVISLLLGAVALIPLAVEVLFVLRGVLYGVVDHGPYDTSWGGPTRTGAWVAHFLISLPLALAAAAGLIGIAAVHQRLTLALAGARPARWLIPVAVLLPLPAAALFVAWLHQI